MLCSQPCCVNEWLLLLNPQTEVTKMFYQRCVNNCLQTLSGASTEKWERSP